MGMARDRMVQGLGTVHWSHIDPKVNPMGAQPGTRPWASYFPTPGLRLLAYIMDLIPAPASQVGVQMERVNNYTALSAVPGTQ